jgi:hypothetical protein
MTDKTTFTGLDVVCSHQLLVQFDQMADGTVAWRMTPDKVVAQSHTLDTVHMAAAGAPAAALGIRALWKLCEDGLINHALEQAFGVQTGVRTLLMAEPGEVRLEGMPVESPAIN